MGSLDSLAPDQRAVLQMVLQRGRSYDQIADLLGIDRAGVRRRALEGLDALGPSNSIAAPQRALLTDYLLGQLPVRVAEQVREQLAGSPSSRAWARVVSAQIGELAGSPLPEIPIESGWSDDPAADAADRGSSGAEYAGPPPRPELGERQFAEQPLTTGSEPLGPTGDQPADDADDEPATAEHVAEPAWAWSEPDDAVAFDAPASAPAGAAGLHSDMTGDPDRPQEAVEAGPEPPATGDTPAEPPATGDAPAEPVATGDTPAEPAAVRPSHAPPRLITGSGSAPLLTTTPSGGRRSSRRGGAALLALVALVVVAAVVVVIVTNSGGTTHKPGSSTNTGSTTTSTTTTSTSSTTPTSATVVKQVNLLAPTPGSKAKGIADIVRDGATLSVLVYAQNVPPNTASNAYAVWLYTSPASEDLLGFVDTRVGADGKLQTEGRLPANAGTYKQLLVTIETQGKPKVPGQVIVKGAFTLS